MKEILDKELDYIMSPEESDEDEARLSLAEAEIF